MKKKALAMLLAVVMAAGLLPGTARAADGEDKASSVKVETLVEPIYDEAGSFGYDENGDTLYAAVKVDGKWGYIDLTGEMVIEPQYDYAASFQEGVALAAKQNYYIGLRYDRETGESYEVAEPDGYQIYLLSADGRETPLQRYYYSASDVSYGYEDYIVYNYVWDYDLRTYVVVNPIDSTWGCRGGVVYAGYPYLPDGTPIVPRDIESLLPPGHTYSILHIPSYSPDLYDNPVMWGPCVDGVIPMRIEYYWEGHDEEHDGPSDQPAEDRGAICFYMDTDGNITRVFPMSSFDPNGYDGVYAAYAPDGTGLSVVNYGGYNEKGALAAGYGAMRADGTWAVPPEYLSFRYFLDGTFFAQDLWVVTRDGVKWGAVDADGAEVIPMEYDAMTGFTDDLSAVQKDGQWYYIDRYNNAYQIGTPEGGVADHILFASHFSGNIAAVYDGDSGRAYCIVNTPVDGVLPAVQGTEDLAPSVYFPDYERYLETGSMGLVFPVGEYAAIERDGKWGFLKLSFELENLNPFADIHLGDFYYDAVQWAAANLITVGTNDGTTFSPEDYCKHIEILTFLWRAAGWDESAPEAPMPMDHPDYQHAVNWAYERGMITEDFDPEAYCSRSDAVMYIWQALADREEDIPPSSFSDVSPDDDYAKAVDWAVAKGITVGDNSILNTFNPGKFCDRGEIVTFLHRAYVSPYSAA